MMHINVFETLAVKFSLLSLFSTQSHLSIRIMPDNAILVCHDNAMGGA